MSKASELIFAPEQDQPIRYIDRTRSYYLGLGYEHPYVWAHYVDVPFTPLKKPLHNLSWVSILPPFLMTPVKDLKARALLTMLQPSFISPINSRAKEVSIYELPMWGLIARMPIWKTVIAGSHWTLLNERLQ